MSIALARRLFIELFANAHCLSLRRRLTPVNLENCIHDFRSALLHTSLRLTSALALPVWGVFRLRGTPRYCSPVVLCLLVNICLQRLTLIVYGRLLGLQWCVVVVVVFVFFVHLWKASTSILAYCFVFFPASSSFFYSLKHLGPCNLLAHTRITYSSSIFKFVMVSSPVPDNGSELPKISLLNLNVFLLNAVPDRWNVC